MIARLAAPPAPAVHVRAADADPKLLHETSIEWAPGVDPAALVWCRERLVRNVYGRTGRPSLRYYRLLGWGNVSPAAPECGGMRNCFVRRMFFLTREDDPAAPKAATAIDPKTVRPGVFGTPIRAPLGEGPSH
jgi:hypothetical protein